MKTLLKSAKKALALITATSFLAISAPVGASAAEGAFGDGEAPMLVAKKSRKPASVKKKGAKGSRKPSSVGKKKGKVSRAEKGKRKPSSVGKKSKAGKAKKKHSRRDQW